MCRIQGGNPVFHDLGRGYRLRFCGANTAAYANSRPIPGCLGLDCKEKCQQTECYGKRCAPMPRGSGERSQHKGSLPCGCERDVAEGRRRVSFFAPAAEARNRLVISNWQACPFHSSLRLHQRQARSIRPHPVLAALTASSPAYIVDSIVQLFLFSSLRLHQNRS